MANLITETGRALYGARWIPQMAEDLNVAERTVRRWASEEFQVPQGVWNELRDLLAARIKTLMALDQKLTRAWLKLSA